ncbi:uncharacterized protein TNCV_4770651 [Trichonephila clavipes]|nr:uncharacterized protein TNCV_4770651 [Trichonephila clavipes]
MAQTIFGRLEAVEDDERSGRFLTSRTAAEAEWSRYRIVAGFVTSSSPVPLKTRRVGQRCMLNLSRAETSSRWCGVVVRRGGTSSVVVPVTGPWLKISWSVAKSPRVAEQCDVNINSTQLNSWSVAKSPRVAEQCVVNIHSLTSRAGPARRFCPILMASPWLSG